MSLGNVIQPVSGAAVTAGTVDIQQSGTFTTSRTLSVSGLATPYTPAQNEVVDMVWLGYVDGTNTEGQITLAEIDGANNILDELKTTFVTGLVQGQIVMEKISLEAGKIYAMARRTTQGDGRVYAEDGYLRIRA